MMIAAILEKLVYVTTMIALYVQERIKAGQVAVASPDFVLVLL